MLEVTRPIPATPTIPVPVPGDIVEFCFTGMRGNWYLGLVVAGGLVVIMDRAINSQDGSGWPLFAVHPIASTWENASVTRLKVFKHSTLTIVA